MSPWEEDWVLLLLRNQEGEALDLLLARDGVKWALCVRRESSEQAVVYLRKARWGTTGQDVGYFTIKEGAFYIKLSQYGKCFWKEQS